MNETPQKQQTIPIHKPTTVGSIPIPSSGEKKEISVNPQAAGVPSFKTMPSSVKTNYPTEVIDLPSEGFFYSPTSPLSTGKLELKYMTAREEDILTSQNLIKKGVVLDALLSALIVNPDVKLDDILIGDKNAIFVAARILAYGKDYPVKIKCPSCGEENEDNIDLSSFKSKEFDFSKYVRGTNRFEFELPICKHVLTYKLLTHRDEQAIDSELKSMAKFSKGGGSSPEITTRLKYLIVAVDGNDDRNVVKKFVDTELSSRDSLPFRTHARENSPDINMDFNFTCPACGHAEVMPCPMGVQFFWPSR